MKKFLLIALLFSLLILIVCAAEHSVQTQIENWAVENNYQVISVERVWWFPTDCPFYRYKNDDLRRIKVRIKDGGEVTFYSRYEPLTLFHLEIRRAIN